MTINYEGSNLVVAAPASILEAPGIDLVGDLTKGEKQFTCFLSNNLGAYVKSSDWGGVLL